MAATLISATVRGYLDKVSERAFVAAIVMLSLQWIPNIPIRGAQISDLFFLLSAIALALSPHRFRRLPAIDSAWIGFFVMGVFVSALVNGGSYLKLLGHFELVTIMLVAFILCHEQGGLTRLRQALIWAAILAALTGLLGALLFFLGHQTLLLNHFGDLLPGDYPRIRGTCFKVNMLATVLATGFVLLWAEDRTSMVGRFRYPVAILLGTALLFTFSRTGPALGAGLLALYALRRPTRAKNVLAASSILLVIALLFVSARYTILLEPTHFWQVAISSEPGTRWVIWRGALDTIAANPIFGGGPGAYATNTGWSAHLVWLNLWAVLGVMPLCAFAVGIYRALARYRVAPYLAAALGVIVLDGFARDVEDMRHLWVLMGMLLAAGSLEHAKIRS